MKIAASRIAIPVTTHARNDLVGKPRAQICFLICAGECARQSEVA